MSTNGPVSDDTFPTPSPPSPPDDAHGVDRVVFGVALALTLGLVLWGVLDAEGLSAAATAALNAVIGSTSWIFVLGTTAFVVLILGLAFSRFGRIRLGRDDEEPEFSVGSWISMMFATGMGIGLIFWGAAEPLSHLATPPLELAAPQSQEAARLSMQYTLFHWGLHPWALYGIVGLALAYATFRKGRPNLLSSIVFPNRPVRSAPRRVVDIFAVFITTFGAATSLGLGAVQINSGLGSAFGVPSSTWVSILVIAVLTALFVVSAVSGVGRGVKWMANTNAFLAVYLMAFVFVFGPTIFLLNTFSETIGSYLSEFVTMSFTTGAFGGQEWLNGWTIFYWAWWMSWAPFVGVFMARISRGRTIREFAVCVLLAPTLLSAIWFAIMGGTAIRTQLTGVADLTGSLEASGVEGVLFGLLDTLPIPAVMAVVVVILIMLFYVAGADAAAVVLGMLCSGGSLHPQRWLVILWGAMIGLVACVLLLAGGLSAIQTACIVLGVPFLLVLFGVAVSLVRQLAADPAARPGVATRPPTTPDAVAANGRSDPAAAEPMAAVPATAAPATAKPGD